jgi:hypothetical protein
MAGLDHCEIDVAAVNLNVSKEPSIPIAVVPSTGNKDYPSPLDHAR